MDKEKIAADLAAMGMPAHMAQYLAALFAQETPEPEPDAGE